MRRCEARKKRIKERKKKTVWGKWNTHHFYTSYHSNDVDNQRSFKRGFFLIRVGEGKSISFSTLSWDLNYVSCRNENEDQRVESRTKKSSYIIDQAGFKWPVDKKLQRKTKNDVRCKIAEGMGSFSICLWYGLSHQVSAFSGLWSALWNESSQVSIKAF